MYNITVQRGCGCFKKSPLESDLSFESKEEALSKAQEMKTHMNTKFCGKHHYEFNEEGDTITFQKSINENPSS